mmetsp:Transcript_1078/g.2406  ORF Transcript_1078/g.2406 Transcript_1078/m.2406 type:complete len:208 (+) Transcript_1078:295-918(+)
MPFYSRANIFRLLTHRGSTNHRHDAMRFDWIRLFSTSNPSQRGIRGRGKGVLETAASWFVSWRCGVSIGTVRSKGFHDPVHRHDSRASEIGPFELQVLGGIDAVVVVGRFRCSRRLAFFFLLPLVADSAAGRRFRGRLVELRKIVPVVVFLVRVVVVVVAVAAIAPMLLLPGSRRRVIPGAAAGQKRTKQHRASYSAVSLFPSVRFR